MCSQPRHYYVDCILNILKSKKLLFIVIFVIHFTYVFYCIFRVRVLCKSVYMHGRLRCMECLPAHIRGRDRYAVAAVIGPSYKVFFSSLTDSLFYQVPISWSRLWLYLDVSMSSFIFSLPCLRLIFSLMSVSHIIVSWIVYPVFEITKIIFILTFIFMLILFTLYFFVCRPTLADPVFCCGWGGSIDAEGA